MKRRPGKGEVNYEDPDLYDNSRSRNDFEYESRGPILCLIASVGVVILVVGLAIMFGVNTKVVFQGKCAEFIVVANRNDTSMSWIDTDDESVFTPEFIGFDSNYAWAPRDRDEVCVTDFFGGGFGVFNSRTKRMTDFYNYPGCNGSMHMFGNTIIDQAWIPCRLSNTIHAAWYTSGHQIAVMTENATLPSHEPHDVSVADTAAFVSFNSSTTSYVVRYSTSTFTKTGQIQLPYPNAHTLWDRDRNRLYGTANNAVGGSIYLFDPTTSVPTILAEITLPSSPAHGFIFNEKFLYVADFGVNPASIHKIVIGSFTLKKSWSLPGSIIHNIELSGDNRKLFITQTALDSVLAIDIDQNGDILVDTKRTVIPYIENPAGLYRTHKMCGLPESIL